MAIFGKYIFTLLHYYLKSSSLKIQISLKFLEIYRLSDNILLLYAIFEFLVENVTIESFTKKFLFTLC